VTRGTARGRPSGDAVLVFRLLQAGIAAVLAFGLVTLHVGIVVNAALALAVTTLPAVLRRDHGVVLGPRITGWILVSLFLHSVGMAGLYGAVRWWDHLTHVVSAALVTGVAYALVRSADEHSEAVRFTTGFLLAFVFLTTVALGVAWELAEYGARELARATGMDPILVVYGIDDTLADLAFDMLGGVLAMAFWRYEFEGLVESLVARLDRQSGPE
jgi:hypothetical protein